MCEVGIRALKQNASAVVAQAARGERIVITDRGRPVAQLSPLASTRLDRLVDAGQARLATRSLADLPPTEPGTPLSPALREARDDERF